jgi:hypothetical protein
VRKILKRFFIGIEFGMVAAAIQGRVDCEDYISHLIAFCFDDADHFSGFLTIKIKTTSLNKRAEYGIFRVWLRQGLNHFLTLL